MSSKRAKAYTYLLLVALFWGVASPVIKFTLGGIDPLPFISYRLAISSTISIIFFARKILHGKKFHQLKKHFPLALLYGFFAVPLALGILFMGLDNSTVLDLTLISVIGPMIVTAGGALFFREHITKREKIGISVVLIGVLINSFYPIFKSEGARLTGNVLLLIYLFADSSSVLIAKKASKYGINPSNLTNLAFIVGALTIIPITGFTYGWDELINEVVTLPFKYHLGVWYMAIISGTLSYYLFIRGNKSIEVSEGVLFNYLQPIFTVPLAIFWLGEDLTLNFVIGALFIVVGLVVAESKRRRRKLKAKIVR